MLQKDKNKIKRLRNKGLTFKEISEIMGCCTRAVRRNFYGNTNHTYDTIEGKSYWTRRRELQRQKNELFYIATLKAHAFLHSRVKVEKENKGNRFKRRDFITKIYELLQHNPICYLTGDIINVYDSNSYNLDHIISLAKGGSRTIENVGIATRDANMAKLDMSVDEFILMCKKVLIHNGYKVEMVF
jgi:5-methylcytosine-specific restriction endonuclease McrA